MQGGLDVLTGGTDVHLVLVDLGMEGLNGKEAEDRLVEVGITVNRNAIPFDQRPPMQASGLRIGTPALTTRGMVEEDMREIGQVICAALDAGYDDARREELTERTKALVERYPLYPTPRPPPSRTLPLEGCSIPRRAVRIGKRSLGRRRQMLGFGGCVRWRVWSSRRRLRRHCRRTQHRPCSNLAHLSEPDHDWRGEPGRLRRAGPRRTPAT